MQDPAARLYGYIAEARYAKLLSMEEYRTAAAAVQAAEGAVDINTAGLEELMALPGIGETRAQAILDDREANGPFRYPEELVRVKGIGEGVLEGFLDQITTGG